MYAQSWTRKDGNKILSEDDDNIDRKFLPAWFRVEYFYAATILLTIMGIVFTAYWNILQTLNTQAVARATYETRLSIDELEIHRIQDNNDRLASELRAAISTIKDGVTQLQIDDARKRK